MNRRRATFIALACATIVVGLLVHIHGTAIEPDTRDMLGDALWAAMIAWWVGALAPSMRFVTRSAVAYAVCVCVEMSQLYHAPVLDALRATQIGALVLGSGFDLRDLVAYACGVVLATLLETAVMRRNIPPSI
jgi:hypothetical protein